jgi:2-polyprenyl-3-methyl-5-hydroxy-6-metoxy-1,4-benzoquinol methylase
MKKSKMKNSVYHELKSELNDFKKEALSLEKAIELKSVKQIDKLTGSLSWILLKIHKDANDKGVSQSIQDMKEILKKYRGEKRKAKRKYIPVKKQYSLWAKEYDINANLLIALEEESIKEFINNVRGKQILDLGCGTGRHTIAFAKKGAEITAIDFTSAMLKRAKQKAKIAKVIDKINFKQGDITNYAPEKKFDFIISMLVQDHIKDIRKTIDVIDSASKIGTEIIISNVHPSLLIKDADKKTGRAQGYLVDGYRTDQFCHPLEEYVRLFKEKGIFLTQVKSLIASEHFMKIKKFKRYLGLKGQEAGIIMKFEKLTE